MTTNKQRRIGFPTSANVGGLSSILVPMFTMYCVLILKFTIMKDEEFIVGTMFASMANKLYKYDPFKKKGLTDKKRAELRKIRKKKKRK